MKYLPFLLLLAACASTPQDPQCAYQASIATDGMPNYNGATMGAAIYAYQDIYNQCLALKGSNMPRLGF